MNEFECFTQAAELNCEWFRIVNSSVEFLTPSRSRGEVWIPLYELNNNGQRIAAKMCEKWWEDRYKSLSLNCDGVGTNEAEEDRRIDIIKYIEMAREVTWKGYNERY